jgi:hypothetical protein
MFLKKISLLHRKPMKPARWGAVVGFIALIINLTGCASYIVEQSATTSGELVTIHPLEIDNILVNPGMGWQTFHSYRDVTEDYPDSSMAYFRWWWGEIQPERDNIRFDIIDDVLNNAIAHGQQLALGGIMPKNGGSEKKSSIPQWLIDMGCKGKGIPFPGGDWQTSWEPFYDDPVYLREFGRLIKKLGERYDGHPAIAHVDIRIMGHAGESWTATVPYPSAEAQQKLVDLYFDAFKNTPLVSLIGAEEMVPALKYAAGRGAGWRGDCWGNDHYMGPIGYYYFDQLDRADALSAWKRGPVCFEICGATFFDWGKEAGNGWGTDLEMVYQKTLEAHASAVHASSSESRTSIPEHMRGWVEKLSKKLGYRYVLRQMKHDNHVGVGKQLKVEMEWVNIGIAPCYVEYPFALQLQSTDGKVGWQGISKKMETKLWLPGRKKVVEEFTLPKDIKTGEYKLRLAFLGYDDKPALKLAIAGRNSDGWYTVSKVKVAKNE